VCLAPTCLHKDFGHPRWPDISPVSLPVRPPHLEGVIGPFHRTKNEAQPALHRTSKSWCAGFAEPLFSGTAMLERHRDGRFDLAQAHTERGLVAGPNLFPCGYSRRETVKRGNLTRHRAINLTDSGLFLSPKEKRSGLGRRTSKSLLI